MPLRSSADCRESAPRHSQESLDYFSASRLRTLPSVISSLFSHAQRLHCRPLGSITVFRWGRVQRFRRDRKGGAGGWRAPPSVH